jgi:CHAT domain-containing protein
MDKDGLYRAETDSMSVDHYVAHRALTVGKESLSGIILRKGNLSWKSPTITDENDDILTSDEIENLTFPKLNLTVLSACETGLGDVDSEGVWGLQRAFRIAGTQSLICSLCRIDDKWTARFMEEFYRHAVAGETIYDSFHAARSFLFRENKKNAKVWSSMILIE